MDVINRLAGGDKDLALNVLDEESEACEFSEAAEIEDQF
jgi:hypothetical protein